MASFALHFSEVEWQEFVVNTRCCTANQVAEAIKLCFMLSFVNHWTGNLRCKSSNNRQVPKKIFTFQDKKCHSCVYGYGINYVWNIITLIIKSSTSNFLHGWFWTYVSLYTVLYVQKWVGELPPISKALKLYFLRFLSPLPSNRF